LHPGLGNTLVLLAGSPADPDRADDPLTAPEWHPASEDHHASVVRGVNAEERASRLTVFGKVSRAHVERTGCEGLVDGNVDCTDPGAIHPGVRDETSAGIDHGDVHGLADRQGFGLGGGDYTSGVFKGTGHEHLHK